MNKVVDPDWKGSTEKDTEGLKLSVAKFIVSIGSKLPKL